MSRLSVTLPDEEFKKLEAALNPKEFKKAIFEAVKRATIHITKVVKKNVEEQTGLKEKYVKEAITAQAPKGDSAEGFVIVKGHGLPLTAFDPKWSKEAGVTVTPSANMPPIILKHAFIATMKSGHKGVMARKRWSEGHQFKQRLGKTGHPIMTVTKSGFAEHLPIKEEYGPSIVTLVNVPEIEKSIMGEAQEALTKEAESQLERFTKLPTPASPAA